MITGSIKTLTLAQQVIAYAIAISMRTNNKNKTKKKRKGKPNSLFNAIMANLNFFCTFAINFVSSSTLFSRNISTKNDTFGIFEIEFCIFISCIANII